MFGLALGGLVAGSATASAAVPAAGAIDCNPTGQSSANTAFSEPAVLAPAEAVGAPAASSFAAFGIGQQIVYDSARGISYVGFFDGTGTLTVSERSASGSWSSVHPLAVGGAAVKLHANSTANSQDGDDSHVAISMAIDETGALHLTGATHDQPMNYWRATTAGSIADLRYFPTILNPANEGVVTYSTFFNDKNGALYLIFRNGVSDAANEYLYRYQATTKLWTNPTTVLFNGAVEKGPTGHYFEASPNNRGPYVSTPIYDAANDAYYLTWVWRSDGASTDSNSRLSYAWSRDLVTWYPMQVTAPAASKAISLPFRYQSADTRAIVDDAPYGGLFNGNINLGFDASHRPVLSYFRNNHSLETKLYTARPTGPYNSASSTWRISDITATPNSSANVTGDPTASYRSAWRGRAGDSTTTLFANTPITVNGDGTMTVRYSCNGVARRIIFTNTGTSGVSYLVSDGFDPNRTVPPSIETGNPEFAAYGLATRTAMSPPFVVPSATFAPGVAQGTGARWVLRWESGPYLANGMWPAFGSYPDGGTPLTLQLITQ